MYKLGFLFLGGLMLVLGACGGGAASSTVAAVNVEANDFKFEPARITVKPGQSVKMTFRNKGSVDHDFSVMKIPVANSKSSDISTTGHDMSHMAVEPDLHVVAAPGKSSTWELTPNQAGEYEFQCTVVGHKEAGMVGRLIVK